MHSLIKGIECKDCFYQGQVLVLDLLFFFLHPSLVFLNFSFSFSWLLSLYASFLPPVLFFLFFCFRPGPSFSLFILSLTCFGLPSLLLCPWPSFLCVFFISTCFVLPLQLHALWVLFFNAFCLPPIRSFFTLLHQWAVLLCIFSSSRFVCPILLFRPGPSFSLFILSLAWFVFL